MRKSVHLAARCSALQAAFNIWIPAGSNRVLADFLFIHGGVLNSGTATTDMYFRVIKTTIANIKVQHDTMHT